MQYYAQCSTMHNAVLCTMQYYAQCTSTHWCRTQLNDPLEDNSYSNYPSEPPLFSQQKTSFYKHHTDISDGYQCSPLYIHLQQPTPFWLLFFLPPMLNWIPTCWASDPLCWLACHWNKRWACCYCREHDKNCFDIHKIRILEQSKHQMKIQRLQGRLNWLHEDLNVPGISTAAMKLVQL